MKLLCLSALILLGLSCHVESRMRPAPEKEQFCLSTLRFFKSLGRQQEEDRRVGGLMNPTVIGNRMFDYMLAIWDADSTDCMSLEEVQQMWQDLDLNGQDATEYFDELDQDANGCIEREEWIEALDNFGNSCGRYLTIQGLTQTQRFGD